MISLLFLMMSCGNNMSTTGVKHSRPENSSFKDEPNNSKDNFEDYFVDVVEDDVTFADSDMDMEDESSLEEFYVEKSDTEKVDTEGFNEREEFTEREVEVESDPQIPVEKLRSDLILTLRKNKFDEFVDIIKIKSSIIYENFEDYGGSSGYNNILHVICNTGRINGSVFMNVIHSLSIDKFKSMILEYNGEGFLPADLALLKDNTESIKFLLDFGSIHFFEGEKGISIDVLRENIERFVKGRKTEMLNLINRAYYPRRGIADEFDKVAMFRERDKKGKDFIYYAVLNGDIWMVDYLLGKKVDLSVNYEPNILSTVKKDIKQVNSVSSASKDVKNRIYKLIKSRRGKPDYSSEAIFKAQFK